MCNFRFVLVAIMEHDHGYVVAIPLNIEQMIYSGYLLLLVEYDHGHTGAVL